MRTLSLEYHDVVEPGAADASGFGGPGPASYKLDRAIFDRHLSAVADKAVNSPASGLDWLAAGARAPATFLTFDDGGASAHAYIADALERHGWVGHFFMTAGRIGSPTFLSAGQIRDLQRRGHVIGTHSYSHPARMGACSQAELEAEWSRSCAMLADILGEPVLTGSVPGGFYTLPVARTAAAAGVRLLFTSAPTTRLSRVDGCVVLGRYTLRRWSPPGTAGRLAAGAWRPRLAQWVLYSGLGLVRTLAGDHYTRLRQRYWGSRA